ncbi:MAG: nucleoside/nucleotide kinase family protein [Pseudomonadota bacterium]
MTLEVLVKRITALPSDRRQIVAIAGPPASGKSTLAEQLVAALGPTAVLLPMDGFHLDNRILEHRNLLHRKGAPETFDVHGLSTLLQRATIEDQLFAPIFDRTLDIAVAGAIEITGRHQILIIEGNYLLLKDPHWNKLTEFWDLTIWLDVADDQLEHRLTERWLSHGLDPEAARLKVTKNDLPNARLTKTRSTTADIVL